MDLVVENMFVCPECWFWGDGKRFAARWLSRYPDWPGGAVVFDPLPLFRMCLIEFAG
jgi:hypothetical protein